MTRPISRFSLWLSFLSTISALHSEMVTEAFIDSEDARKSITRFDDENKPQPVQAVFLVPNGYQIQSASKSGVALLVKETENLTRFWRWQYAQVDFLTAVSYIDTSYILQGGYGRCSANGDIVISRNKYNRDWISTNDDYLHIWRAGESDGQIHYPPFYSESSYDYDHDRIMGTSGRSLSFVGIDASGRIWVEGNVGGQARKSLYSLDQSLKARNHPTFTGVDQIYRSIRDVNINKAGVVFGEVWQFIDYLKYVEFWVGSRKVDYRPST